MTTNISQSLLSDAVDNKRHILRQILRNSFRLDLHLHGLEARDAVTLGLQRLDQTEIIEYGWMQAVRKIVDILAQLREPRAYRLTNLTRWRQVATGKLGGVDGQSSEPLGNIIVQLTREPAPLVFMRGDQASAQGLCFSLGMATADTLPRESDR